MLVERLRNAEYGKIMIPWTILVLLFVLIRAHAVEAEKAPGDDMICIPAEEFLMGSDTGDPDEKPVRSVYLDTFYIDRHEVTNADFQRFVEETGYVTDAEKRGYGRIWARTWKTIFNASWRHPEGPESDLSNRMDHPVVQVSWHDANAYCRWAGKRLPKEAEWEKTCRGRKEDDIPGGRSLSQVTRILLGRRTDIRGLPLSGASLLGPALTAHWICLGTSGSGQTTGITGTERSSKSSGVDRGTTGATSPDAPTGTGTSPPTG